MEKIVLIDGMRTPFMRAGTTYMDTMSYELGQFAIKGLLTKTGIDPAIVDQVILGTVISNLKTSNVAREAALSGGLQETTPCHTVTMACISANRAISTAVAEMLAGQYEVAIAGGVDCTSDTPITFRKAMQKKLFKAQKIKSMGDSLKFLASLKFKDFMPERPRVAEYSTNRVMGQDCDIMAARFEVSRSAQDEFAVRSHHLAEKAWQDGHLGKEVVEVALAPKFRSEHKDNGIRGNSSIEKVGKLRPAFDKKYGTLTAANSSFLTDGGAVCLLMTERKAKELGLPIKAEIVDYVFTGQSPEDELLLGPAYATAKILQKTGMKLDDFDVIEFHEAFAGQILSNLRVLEDPKYSEGLLRWKGAVGAVNMDKFNLWGGSLSIGHPFGATGARLLTTSANRLIHEDGQYGLIAACAAGAHGHAMIVKRYAQ